MWILEIDQTLRKGTLTLRCVGELDVRIQNKKLEVLVNEKPLVSFHVGDAIGLHESSRSYDDHSVLSFTFAPTSCFAEILDHQTEDLYDIFCRQCQTRVLSAEGREGYLLPSGAWTAFSESFACEECAPWRSHTGGPLASEELLFHARPGRVYWTSAQAVVHPSDAEVHGNSCRQCSMELGTLAEDGQSLALDKSCVSMYRDDDRENEHDMFHLFSSPSLVALQLADMLVLDPSRHFLLQCAEGGDDEQGGKEELEVRVVRKECILHSDDGVQRMMRVWYRAPMKKQGGRPVLISTQRRFAETLKQLDESAMRDFPPSLQKIPGHWLQAYLPLPVVQ